MRLNLTAIGNTNSDGPKSFYRVSTWGVGRYVADFTTQLEAERFAIDHAKSNGYKYDHKVSFTRLTK